VNYASDTQLSLITDVTGAGESVEILINDNDIDFLDYIYDLSILSDQRLNLSVVITHNKKNAHGSIPQFKERIDDLSESGWEIYETQIKYSASVLMVDGESTYIFTKTSEGYLIDKIEDEHLKAEIISIFQTSTANESNIHLLFEDILFSSFSQNSSKIVTISTEIWSKIIAKLADNPTDLEKLDPRKFEELIAELLIRENMQVQLTPRTKDGGVDIFVEKETVFGKHLYLVECKHYNKRNKVGVSIVRSLYGIVEDKNATKGIIVTTSDFTRGVKSFADLHKNRIDLKNGDSLVNWLNKIRGLNNA
jgi:HJR/Mrr/RecB family endonuclease